MTDRKSIEARIAELKGQLEAVEGTPTEVYSRIVGYYRSVRNWNAGKREEYGQRVAFDLPAVEGLSAGLGRPAREALAAAEAVAAAPEPAPRPVSPTATDLGDGSRLGDSSRLGESTRVRDGVLVFTREACPNCPPVANYVLASGMKAVFVDVDRSEGLALARDFGVMATPTVLALDGEGNEAFRAFDLASLRGKLAEGLGSRLEASAPAGAQ